MVNFVLPTEPIRTPPVRERVTREEAKLSFFATAEGYYDYEKKSYIYQYKDHLGNTRISYARIKGKLEILDQNDYYPFGMNHLQTGSSRFGMGSWQNYKYNGKELQTSGMYDYGARFYMPDIGRWGVIDPLAEKMTRHSPYNYAFNNPIKYIDPDGRESKDWYKDKKGNYVYDAQLNKQNASQKLDKGEKYLGESVVVHIKDKKNSDVGKINLGKDGGISVSGKVYDEGKVTWSTKMTNLGTVQVVNANLVNGKLAYGVSVFDYEFNKPMGGKTFEYNAKDVYEGNIQSLVKSVQLEIDKINNQVEISTNSISEGSFGDPSMGSAFGAIGQRYIANKKISELNKKISEIKKLQE